MTASLSDATVARLERLSERMAISDVLIRYCRGIDRMDRPLALSCWHPGGTDDRAPLYTGSADGLLDLIWPLHDRAIVFRHVLTNMTIDVDGERAGAESYWTLIMRLADGEGAVDLFSGGRYVDNFECIDGVWAIRHRRVIREWSRVDPVPTRDGADLLASLVQAMNPDDPATAGRRDREDCSYAVLPVR